VDLQQSLIALSIIVYKEIRRFMRIWIQTLIPPIITMTLYFVIFGSLIGSRVGSMGGFDYMQYITPGLVMMSVITNAYSNVASSFFGAKFQRSVEEMLVSPMPSWVIVAGFVLGGVARGLLVGALVLVVSLFFTDIHIQNIGLTVLFFFGTAVLFALGGFLNAVFSTKFDDISIVPTFILTPLTYLGGVFYSIDMLPEVWQWVSLANPVVYIISAFRTGMLGAGDVPVWVSVVMVSGFIAILFAGCVWCMEQGKGMRN